MLHFSLFQFFKLTCSFAVVFILLSVVPPGVRVYYSAYCIVSVWRFHVSDMGHFFSIEEPQLEQSESQRAN